MHPDRDIRTALLTLYGIVFAMGVAVGMIFGMLIWMTVG